MARHRPPRRLPPLIWLVAAWVAWLPLVGLRIEGGEAAASGQSFWSVEVVVGWQFAGAWQP